MRLEALQELTALTAAQTVLAGRLVGEWHRDAFLVQRVGVEPMEINIVRLIALTGTSPDLCLNYIEQIHYEK